MEYCWQCAEYPCARYEGIDEYDSFITHRNQRADLEKAQRIGLDAYRKEQAEKCEIPRFLLENYQDGRRKSGGGIPEGNRPETAEETRKGRKANGIWKFLYFSQMFRQKSKTGHDIITVRRSALR